MEVEHLAARYNPESDKFEVANRVLNDDGTTTMMLHVFPPDTLEWRAAEYGIDPTDLDTLLDIVLNEPFAEGDPPLWRVKDRDEARSLLLEDVNQRKQRLAPPQRRGDGPSRADTLREAGVPDEYVVAAEEDTRDFLKRAARVNPDVVAVMAADVDRKREKIKEAKPLAARALAAPEAAMPKDDPQRAVEWNRRLNLSRRSE